MEMWSLDLSMHSTLATLVFFWKKYMRNCPHLTWVKLIVLKQCSIKQTDGIWNFFYPGTKAQIIGFGMARRK